MRNVGWEPGRGVQFGEEFFEKYLKKKSAIKCQISKVISWLYLPGGNAALGRLQWLSPIVGCFTPAVTYLLLPCGQLSWPSTISRLVGYLSIHEILSFKIQSVIQPSSVAITKHLKFFWIGKVVENRQPAIAKHVVHQSELAETSAAFVTKA